MGNAWDVVLATQIPEFSRSYLQQLIDAGSGSVARRCRSQTPQPRYVSGDAISIELRPTPQTQAFRPESMALDVVHQDADVLVLNKPAGLVVHPAPGNWSGTLLNGLLARDPRAGLVTEGPVSSHRLDKGHQWIDGGSPGLDSRWDRLVQAIAARLVRRQYLAIGTPLLVR
jgi:23S rRNA pseudouridine1911/1915/1917 synthase